MTDPFLSANKQKNRINIEALKRVISEMDRDDLEAFLLSEYLTAGMYCEVLGPLNFASLQVYGFDPKWLEELSNAGVEAIQKAIVLSAKMTEEN